MERTAIDKLLALAASQHHLFTVTQAADIDITLRMLRAAVARGWIDHQRRGVYVAAGAPPSKWRPVVAATMMAGPDAVVSHSSAAAMHGFDGVVSEEIELTVPWSPHRTLQGVLVHRSKTLLPTDTEERKGVQVTNPVRTLIDVADRFSAARLAVIVDEGTIARLWAPEEVKSRLAKVGSGVAGVATLREVVAERLGEGHQDSRLEQRVLRALKHAAPGYTVHHQEVLEGRVVDMDIAWVEHKVDGEVDGLAVRAASRTKFERQSLRENILGRNGWTIVHFTAKMDDATLVAQVAPLLGL